MSWSEAEYERVKQHIRENKVVGIQSLNNKGWTTYADQLVEDGVVEFDDQNGFYNWDGPDEERADAQYMDGSGEPIFPHEFGVDDVDFETYVLEDAIETVYERPDKHGEPEDSFARIARFWSTYLGTQIDADQVAMMMALLKIARSAEGVYDEDNPRDIAGYAENYARLNSGVEE